MLGALYGASLLVMMCVTPMPSHLEQEIVSINVRKDDKCSGDSCRGPRGKYPKDPYKNVCSYFQNPINIA